MIQSNFIQANGIHLHYWRTGGNKPQVVLLHGIAGRGQNWTPFMEALQDDYDCIAPDARGHGLSEAPEQGYTYGHYMADAAGLIEALHLNRPVAIGHSMGGAVATALAASHPNLVRALVVEDPAWVREPGQTLEERRATAIAWRAGLLVFQANSDAEMIADQRARSPRWSDADLALWAAGIRQTHIRAMDNAESVPVDWRQALTMIQCPVLLVMGDASKDIFITPEQAQEARALGRDVRIAPIKDAGHSIRLDNPTDYLDAVWAFLRAVTHPAST